MLGIERLSDRLERNRAEFLEHTEKLALDQLDPRCHRVRSPLALGRLEGSIEIVQHREKLPEQGLVGEAYVVLTLAGRTLARVVELGHQPEVSVLKLLDLAGLGVERVLERGGSRTVLVVEGSVGRHIVTHGNDKL